MTFKDLCFSGKLVAGEAELRRLIYMKQCFVNGVLVTETNGEVDVKIGDRVRIGRLIYSAKEIGDKE